MDALVFVLPVLGCAGMMLICMLVMTAGMRRHRAGQDGPATEEAAALREEVARLRAERSPQHLDG